VCEKQFICQVNQTVTKEQILCQIQSQSAREALGLYASMLVACDNIKINK